MGQEQPFDYLSFSVSILICFLFSITYVLALYLLSPSNQRFDRNHPTVIWHRFNAVFCVCSIIYVFLLLFSAKGSNTHMWLGFRTNVNSLWSLLFYPVLLTLLLFLGPILQGILFFDRRYYRIHGIQNWFNWNYDAKLIFIRNYLVAPFTEEFVYRSSLICVLYSHVSISSTIFLTPLFFGLAHLHHMIEHFRQYAQSPRHRIPVLMIILSHLFQFSYTYIFGVYSSFLFLRTGHFIPSFLVHALCNGLGVPDIASLTNRNDWSSWTRIIIAISYVMGLVLFFKYLYFLTQPKYYYTTDSTITYRVLG